MTGKDKDTSPAKPDLPVAGPSGTAGSPSAKQGSNPGSPAAAASPTSRTGSSPRGDPSPAEQDAPLAVEEAQGGDDDADSALGEDAASSTASLTSSILKYRTIHGRTFHSERGNAQYWGTNDEGHSESLDILHHLFTLCLDGELYLAPIKDPKKILDVGTGTGIWAIDMADMFPGAEVIGTDVSPIQPGWVPPNLKYEIEDCTQEWTFPDNTFDLVHIRYLLGCIVDWHEFFRQAFKVCRPGGYLESYEASPRVQADDGSLPPDSATARWSGIFIDGGRTIGRSFTVVDDDTQRKAMEAAGFVDVQVKNIKVPSGSWPVDPKLKEIGRFAQFAVDQDIEGFILFVTSVLNWSHIEVQVYMAHLRREFRAGKFHAYYWQKVVWGRKPET